MGVGDDDVGECPIKNCSPNCSNNISKHITVNGRPVKMSIWDTPGQSDWDKLRQRSYPQTDVFLVCFSVMLPKSLENVRTRWAPELHKLCPKVPFLLIGTQSHLRNETN